MTDTAPDGNLATDTANAAEEKAGELLGGALSVLLFVVMVVFAIGCGLLGWFSIA